ncbi:Putative metalloprotease yggG [Salmonella enterica subsp. enterica]|uniref:Metalloprotease yggG n=1 Tax=Salmonella enterica I TaxID=59201 RepID=A0A3S4HSD0_SALET|nr:Putative metalloprotease yggG [Salmonella enterica subsp. enterica]
MIILTICCANAVSVRQDSPPAFEKLAKLEAGRQSSMFDDSPGVPPHAHSMCAIV